MTVPFPKIIHQTWKNNDIPEHWKESFIQWQKLHPGWYYHYTTDIDNRCYVVEHFPEYLETYDKLPYGIQRADMIRYMYLYNMGGVYSDLDIVPTRPLSDYSFDPNYEIYTVPSRTTPNVFTNSLMISKAKCKIWLEMLEYIRNYKKWPLTIRYAHIMYSTGPSAYSKVINRHLDKVCILPAKLFMRFSLEETLYSDCKTIALKEEIYNYAVPGNSWHTLDGEIIIFLFINMKYILLIIFLILVVYLIARKRSKSKTGLK